HQAQHLLPKVHLRPSQGKKLHLPCASRERQHHQWVEIGRVACLTGSQQPLPLFLGEETHPATWPSELLDVAHRGIVQPSPLRRPHGQGMRERRKVVVHSRVSTSDAIATGKLVPILYDKSWGQLSQGYVA